MPSATMSSNGRITVPKAIREALGLRPGDQLAFQIREDGTVVVQPKTIDIMSLAGTMRSAVKGVSIEDMDAAIGDAVARSDRRTGPQVRGKRP